MAKFDALKPWLNLQLWDYFNKEEKKFEQKKAFAANVLKVDPSKVTVKNSFEDKVRELGLPKEALNDILGNESNG